jgi:hypothetical protein
MRRLFYLLAPIFFLLSIKAEANTSASLLFVNNYNTFSISDTTQLKDKKFTIFVSQGLLNIKYAKPNELLNGEIIIYNLLGQEVVRKKLEAVPTNQIAIPIQNTCYLIRINYSGKTHTTKVIVR